MDALKRKCEQICNTDRYGGRIKYIDENTLQIFDIDTWTQEMHNEVVRAVPAASISIHSSHTSITGFSVVITKNTQYKVNNYGYTLVILISTFLLIRHILSDT